MSLNFCNNNSLSAITALPASISGGGLSLISTTTISDSSSVTITSGIDSTYKLYILKLINIHPASDNAELEINFSIDGGSNYNVAKTACGFIAQHNEADNYATMYYDAGIDSNQATGDHVIHENIGGDNDEALCGTIYFYNPSSTVHVKNYLTEFSSANGEPNNTMGRVDGYANTTSAINALKIEMQSGNVQSGILKLYGVS